MFDVGDVTSNTVLNVCFFGLVLLTIATLVPWRSFGAVRANKLARWVFLPVVVLAFVYESAMPSRFDIRVDLILLIPMYVVVVIASAVRWLRSRGA